MRIRLGLEGASTPAAMAVVRVICELLCVVFNTEDAAESFGFLLGLRWDGGFSEGTLDARIFVADGVTLDEEVEEVVIGKASFEALADGDGASGLDRGGDERPSELS